MYIGPSLVDETHTSSVLYTHVHTAEAMPLIDHLGLTRQENFFGHSAPFHCFKGEYHGHQISVVTNGKDRKFGCDNVSKWLVSE